MNYMKKRFLSFVLVLALLLTGVPMAAAAGSGFVDPTVVPEVSQESGPVSLITDTAVSEETEETNENTATPVTLAEGEGKYVDNDSAPFSQSEAVESYADTDVVHLIVELENNSLLAAGFSTDDIAANTAAVASYESRQMSALDAMKSRLSSRFGGSDSFELGYTYTIATTGLSVKTEYGNMDTIAAMPGVKRVYVAPTFQVPEDTAVSDGSDDLLQPMTDNATQMIGSDVLNSTGYTGKGMKVAILDTGIVLGHPSFAALSEDQLTESSMTVEDIEEVWPSLNASSSGIRPANVYYSTKIPYAFNYETRSLDVSHATAGSDHGTHVAGITAANKLDTTDVVGVAPEAQLIVMQVFGSRGANWDTVMAAMEDCVRLNVDAANLSLGSAAGFTTDSDEAMTEVLDAFTKTDIELVIAAGNDTNNALNNLLGWNMSKTSNPDIGLVGTPSTLFQALSVASVNNDKTAMLYFTVGDTKIGYSDTGVNTQLIRLAGQELEYVMIEGYGEAADFEGLDLTGKVAVVERGGEVAFTAKQANAQAAGAVACIVYNNVAGMMNMSITDTAGSIPTVGISKADGKLMAEAEEKVLVVSGSSEEFVSDKVMSDFSSWGCTPDLKLKPEITGVGGNINSTRDNTSGYGLMSGTSMATPQITGAMAVLMQYLRANYPEFQEDVLRRVATNIMLSTADPVMYSDTEEYSPRNQGAGLVNLVKATSTEAYLTSADTYENRPKGEFGDDPERNGVYEFSFEVTNFSEDADKTYTFDVSTLTESVYGGEFIENAPYALNADAKIFTNVSTDVLKYDFNDDGAITTADARVLLRHVAGVETLGTDNVHDAYTDVNGDGEVNRSDVDVILAYCAEMEVDVDLLAKVSASGNQAVTEITVPAGETVSLTAQITLSQEDKDYLNESFENGMFVEGFLYLRNADEEDVDLSMPFMGFYGDWSDAPVFDDDPEEPSLYGVSIWTNNNIMIGANPYIVNGASGDEYNAISYANPLAELDFGLLRNAKQLRYTVTDKNNPEKEYFSIIDEDATKSYYSSSYGMIVPYYIYNANADEEYVWKGYDTDGEALPDGTSVTYKIEAYVDDGDDIVDDVYTFDVTLDSLKPEIVNQDTLQEDLYVREEDGHVILPLTLKDNRYIAAVIFMDANGTIMGKYAVDNQPGEELQMDFDITGYGADFTILVCDYACNETSLDLALELTGEVANPSLKALEPGRLYGFEQSGISSVVDRGWFSVNKTDLSDPRNEAYANDDSYYSGEYINGRVLAERNDGALMLLTPYGSYWGSQQVTPATGTKGDPGFIALYDMAMDYTERSGEMSQLFQDKNIYTEAKNTLYAVGWTYSGQTDPSGADTGANCLYVITSNMYNQQLSITELFPLSGLNPDAEMLTLACDNDGNLYGITTDCNFYSVDKKTGQCTKLFSLDDFYAQTSGIGPNVVQSMCYDHEANCIYWYANCKIDGATSSNYVSRVYRIDPKTGDVEYMGSQGVGGATALFVPTDKTSDVFTYGEVEPETFTLDSYETTMVIGQGKRINLTWTPWNAKQNEVTWTSSDENVVTVSATGYVRAVGAGEATISATATVNDPYAGGVQERTSTCKVTVVPSQDKIYSYIISDDVNQSNEYKWVTYSDLAPYDVTQLTKSEVTAPDGVTSTAAWQGGAYWNGYVYTVCQLSWSVENSTHTGCFVYKSKVDASTDTVIGAPELIGYSEGFEVGSLGFDYNTGRMYGVDLTNGGLCIVDLETGSIDTLGEFQFDEVDNPQSGDNVMPAMTVICQGDETTILCASMNGNLFIVDPETLLCDKVGSAGMEYWYYAAMHYDYNTGNIYWNPCMGQGNNPLYLVTLGMTDWGERQADIIDIGDVASKTGVEQTVMFTIPENEPETKFIPVEDMWLTNGETATIVAGGSLMLRTATEPARPTVQRKTWTSSNTDVATVDNFGVVTARSAGTTTITVTLTDRDGSQFTDTIEITVLASGGTLQAFLAADPGASGYYDFWIELTDANPSLATAGKSMINVYNIRSGEYFDGYYYGYDADNNFYRINATEVNDYKVLGNAGQQIVDMAFDYTTGTMYGVTQQYTAYDINIYEWVNYPATLVSIDLATGETTDVAELDASVRTLAIDQNGVLYGAGSNASGEVATLYRLDPTTGACTSVLELDGVTVFDDNYGDYFSQMTYDYTTDRLYLHGIDCTYGNIHSSQLYMVQLGEQPVGVALGSVALSLRGESKVAPAALGLLCAIPEADELPGDMPVANVIMNKNAARVYVDGTTQLTAQVQPASSSAQVTWTSSDPAVATVDANGLVTGVAAGDAVITATCEGRTTTCSVSVVETTSGAVAYTISTTEGLVKFDPEMPSAGYEVVASFDKLNVGGTVVGLDLDEANGQVYYLVDGDPDYYDPILMRYDLAAGSSQVVGMISVYTDGVSDMAYDAEEQLLYVVCGYYLFQYYVPTMQPTGTNAGVPLSFSGDYSSMHAVAEDNGAVYALGRNGYGGMLYQVDDGMRSYERLATDIDINTVTSFCEMDYCSDNGLFYVTDAGNNLYEMDMSGNVKMLDQLGNGLDINGLAILPAAD